MKIILCLLSLCLCACETAAERGKKMRAEAEAAWAKNYTPATIKIHSAPDGAVIDHNGDVVGITPCELSLPKCYRGGWPLDGNIIQTLRARWIDGTVLTEYYPLQSTPPKTVLFLHPNAVNLMRQAPATISKN